MDVPAICVGGCCSLGGKKNEKKGWGFGISVSKRVGTAVVRNRVKRRLRSLVKLCFMENARVLPGCDYVIIAKKAVFKAPWLDLVQQMEKALGVLRKKLVAQL